MRCERCRDEAVVDRPYAGDHLCAVHLEATIFDRYRREMHRQAPRLSRGTVAVALSGGKDSTLALALAHRYFLRRPTVRLVALTVDEGIAGYRAKGIESARALTRLLGVEHTVVRALNDLGTTTDESARRLPGIAPCSFCGVWRRGLLNRAARAVGATVLVLGFNLDDIAQTVLMNLVHGEVDRLRRMAPHRGRQPGLIPRVAPLATVPEREVYLSASTAGLPFDHGECPHASAAERNLFRELVWRLEEARPGTRQSLLKTRDAIVDLIAARGDEGSPGRCSVCGEPSAHPVCRSCAYLRQVRAEPLARRATGVA